MVAPKIKSMEETNTDPGSEANILDDVYYTFTQASGGKRFANYLIDRIAVYLVWNYLLIKLFTPALRLVYQTTHSMELIYVVSYAFTIAFFIFILAVLESTTGGKTLGKLITGTRAVTQDGGRITAKTAILRALCRLVPFEAFSALGTPCFPWHDRWTKTYVIDEKLTNLPPETA